MVRDRTGRSTRTILGQAVATHRQGGQFPVSHHRLQELKRRAWAVRRVSSTSIWIDPGEYGEWYGVASSSKHTVWLTLGRVVTSVGVDWEFLSLASRLLLSCASDCTRCYTR